MARIVLKFCVFSAADGKCLGEVSFETASTYEELDEEVRKKFNLEPSNIELEVLELQ